MRRQIVLPVAFVAWSLAWAQADVQPVPPALRAELKLDASYTQVVLVETFPIVAVERVSPHALREAAYVVSQMTSLRPELRRELRRRRVRLVVMAPDQLTTQVPEHSDLTPAKFWDRRARGLGATPDRPAVSCGEENLLGYPGDPYSTESILVHEFAHALDQMALRSLDRGFEAKLRRTYRQAMQAGRWAGTYAAENMQEYWAEGVQSWFGTNRSDDDLHNHVDTRAELVAYDPELAALIGSALGRAAWRYVKPAERAVAGHLAGYDPSRAPTFAWPAELEDWYRRYTQGGSPPR